MIPINLYTSRKGRIFRVRGSQGRGGSPGRCRGSRRSTTLKSLLDAHEKRGRSGGETRWVTER